MITKLNPLALNENWGGVLCLTLGSEKPENFDEIYNTLKSIFEQKLFYDIKIFDTIINTYLGDCETVLQTSGYYAIRQVSGADTRITVREYKFYDDGRYERRATNVVG